MDTRKRGRGESGLNGSEGFKKSKPGCPFGENCHFLHYVPGGYKAVAQMMNLAPPPTRAITGAPPAQNGAAASGLKTKICNRYNTAEGCRFGDSCNFAHGEWELGRPINASQEDGPRVVGAISGGYSGRTEQPVPGPTAGFGVSATAKISVAASLVGAIIGKGGMNSKQICRQTGAKLSIREHDTDPNLRNIELGGTFEQMQGASAMVRELIVTIGSSNGSVKTVGGPGAGPPTAGSNFKTKLCENFTKGSCTFGDRCHFAHGTVELRKTGL
ncbi:zinc finger CCCH domain-containing protein 14-like isoform X1 [Henckelia pumila]|uniref:zinc finger CCCH domain-containing protein 14-like isoform X1 n=1 Tax=Henckelia pumila TaxID=405737 RepID=UPI003C6E26A7